jgi:hypothetical protein
VGAANDITPDAGEFADYPHETRRKQQT